MWTAAADPHSCLLEAVGRLRAQAQLGMPGTRAAWNSANEHKRPGVLEPEDQAWLRSASPSTRLGRTEDCLNRTQIALESPLLIDKLHGGRDALRFECSPEFESLTQAQDREGVGRDPPAGGFSLAACLVMLLPVPWLGSGYDLLARSGLRLGRVGYRWARPPLNPEP